MLYIFFPGTSITFSSTGDNIQSFSVTIQDDTLFGPRQTFLQVGEVYESSGTGAFVYPSIATIVITDNDGIIMCDVRNYF